LADDQLDPRGDVPPPSDDPALDGAAHDGAGSSSRTRSVHGRR
jgi:hypothetical protein